jgi:hypothetical protein
MFYGDTVGLRNIVEKMQHFAATFDPQYWQASNLLQELADKNIKLADFSNT